MNSLSQERKGELILLIEIIIWSTLPIISKFSFLGVSPIISASISSLLAGVFFLFIFIYQKRWHELKNNFDWKNIILLSIALTITFAFLFTGTKDTTAGNTAILSQLEVFFTFLVISIIFRKEKIFYHHVIGAAFMILGVIIIYYSKNFSLNLGDIFVIISVFFGAFCSLFAKKALEKTSVISVMMARSFLLGIFLFILAIIFKQTPTFQEFKISFPFLLLNSFLIFGVSRTLMYKVFTLIPVTKAISLKAIYPLFTLIFSYFLLAEIPTIWQVMSIIPFFIGTFLLTRKNN
ncbi:MAG: DMT family transporter [Candidatus Moranbacteria bacterium]|nr:DMT family transporter [Candidatus Moranbacteria bacterium]